MADSAENVEPTSLADVTGIDPVALRRTISYAIQATGLFPHTTVTFDVGGGLGDLASSGITNQRVPLPALRSVLTGAVTLIMDWPGTLVELLLRPRGLEVD